MPLKPLGHRVLIKPDEQPETSDSGLIQLPQDRDHVACSGIVVAVGNGSQALWQARRRGIEHALAAIADGYRYDHDRIAALLTVNEPQPSVQVGDRVVIPVEAGMNVSEDGIHYVIVNEDDLVIIVEDEAAA